jgi:hypothetical protein
MRVRWVLLLAMVMVMLQVVPGRAAAQARKGTTTAKPTAALTVKQSVHFTIKSNLPEPFMKAVLDLCEASLDGYRDLFGLYLYPNPYPGSKRMLIYAVMKPGSPLLASYPYLKPPEIHLALPSDAALNPPGRGGPHHVSGFAHEFAHMAMMFDNPSFSEGFASYMASEVVTYIHRRLGSKAWPRAYDYLTLEGPARLEKWAETAAPGTEQGAAVLLSRIGRQYGREVVGKAVRLLTRSDSHAIPWKNERGETFYTAHQVAAFCQQLVQLTGDAAIVKLFREQHFATLLDPQDIAAAELWAAEDSTAVCQLVCERWKTNVNGILEGSEVYLLLEAWPDQKSASIPPTPEGLTLAPLEGEWALGWYQPATKRTYVVGRVKLLPSGMTVENDAIGPDGRPLGVNPTAASKPMRAAPRPAARP